MRSPDPTRLSPARSRTPSSSTSRRAITRFAFALTAIVLAARFWFIFHRAIDIDEFEHVHATWAVSRGLVPYADFFEHHTPWLYLLFAPLFQHFQTDTDPAAAVSLLLWCRLAMWVVTVATVMQTCALGTMRRDRCTGALAAALLVTSSQFVNKMLDFRPDVPALFFFLASLMAAAGAWRAARTRTAAVGFLASGIAFGAAVMFTQKYLFAAPGLAVGLLVYAATDNDISKRARICRAAWFVIGVTIPIVLTMWWFESHHALGAFVDATVATNIRLNGDRGLSLPQRIVTSVVHGPAVYGFGLAGLIASARLRAGPDAMLTCAAGSLLVGLLLIGRAYDQYFLSFLPLLAVFGAAFADDVLTAIGARLRPDLVPRSVIALLPAASLAALVFFTHERGTTQGLLMIAGFGAAALLAAWALRIWPRGRPVAAVAVALSGLFAFSLGNLARSFESSERQLAALVWVTQHTSPADTALGECPGPAVFRKHAWFYFFLTGPFASERDYAELLDGLESRRIRPQIVMVDSPNPWLRFPVEVRQYVARHYQPVQRGIFERIAE